MKLVETLVKFSSFVFDLVLPFLYNTCALSEKKIKFTHDIVKII